MSQNSNFENNEIDLGELFAALWSHKFFITLFTSLSIFLAGYNALTTAKKFTAKSIFQIEQRGHSSGFNVSRAGALFSYRLFGPKILVQTFFLSAVV